MNVLCGPRRRRTLNFRWTCCHFIPYCYAKRNYVMLFIALGWSRSEFINVLYCVCVDSLCVREELEKKPSQYNTILSINYYYELWPEQKLYAGTACPCIRFFLLTPNHAWKGNKIWVHYDFCSTTSFISKNITKAFGFVFLINYHKSVICWILVVP